MVPVMKTARPLLLLCASFLCSLHAASKNTVAGWGWNDYGQTAAPAGLTNAVAISAGWYHSVALTSEGTVAAWGYGPPSEMPAGLSNVVAVAAGRFHSVALKSNGTVVAWGYGDHTSIPSGLTNVVSIAAGFSHSLALKSNGAVEAWGNLITGTNNYGQTQVPTSLTNVVAIAAGGDHSLALNRDGVLIGWGRNDFGQIAIPVGLNNIKAIAAGAFHSLALQSNGTVVAWGQNANGEASPPPNLSDGMAVAAGTGYSVVLRSNLTASAWGLNSFGQTNLPSGLTNVAAVSAGERHALALLVIQSPAIISPPQNLVVGVGSNVTFSVSATGTPPLFFQWLKEGASLPSATNANLTITNTQTANGGIYSVVVSNAAGFVTSSGASLTVMPPPSITSYPSNQSANATSNIAFTVVATGPTPLNYQWLGLTPLLSGATGTALVAGGFVFDAQVAGGGTGYVQTPAVRFVGGGGSGATATATVSNGAVVSLAIVNPGFGYTSPPTVQIDPPNGFLPSQTNATLTLTNVSLNDAGTYFVVVTNAYGSVTSSPATLTVNVPASITQQPQNVVIPFGSNATFTVGAGGTVPLSYQWFWQPAFARAALAVPDVRNGFVVGAAVVSGGGYYFTAPAVQFLAGSGSGATATTTVSNGRVIAVNIVSPGSSYPSNAVLQIDPPASGPPQPLSGQTAASLALTAPAALASGSYFVVVTNAGGSATSSPALLRVLVPQRFTHQPERLGDGSFRLRFVAHDGSYLLTNDLATLDVWGSTNLANPNAWLRLTNGITVQDGQVQVDDADSPTLPRRFYRVLTR